MTRWQAVEHRISLDDDGSQIVEKLLEPLEISLHPIAECRLPVRLLNEHHGDTLYPPSSKGWYSWFQQDSTKEHIFTVHEIRNDLCLWLFIKESTTERIIFAIDIQNFEYESISVWAKAYYPEPRTLMEKIDALVDGPTPSIGITTKVLEDIIADGNTLLSRFQERLSDLLKGVDVASSIEANSARALQQRFALLDLVMKYQGDIDVKRLGLQRVIYLGAANRWPTHNTLWSARIGNDKVAPYFTEMLAPSADIEKFFRLTARIFIPEVYIKYVNRNLYDKRSKAWSVGKGLFKSSSDRDIDIPLHQRHHPPAPHDFEQRDALILDMMNFGAFPDESRVRSYAEFGGMSLQEFGERLSRLFRKGILKIDKRLPLNGLVTSFLKLDGRDVKTLPIMRKLIDNIPICEIYHARPGMNMLILHHPFGTRESIQNYLSNMSEMPNVLIIPLTNLQSRRFSFFQSLLDPEGKRKNGTEAYLSQLRSIPRTQRESKSLKKPLAAIIEQIRREQEAARNLQLSLESNISERS